MAAIDKLSDSEKKSVEMFGVYAASRLLTMKLSMLRYRIALLRHCELSEHIAVIVGAKDPQKTIQEVQHER